MENEQLPDGAIEVVLDDAPATAEQQPQSPEAQQGSGGNRTGFEQRIAQLTARRHDAERGENEQRERADKLEAELARQRGQIEALANRQNVTDSSVREDYAARERAVQLHDLDLKIGALATDKANALEVGDNAKVSSIDVEIASALIEKRELAAQASGSRSQPQPQAQQPAPQQAPQDPGQAAFLARNQDWWQRDREKTTRAFELHNELKRTNPDIIGSSEYWRMIEEHGRNASRPAVPPLSGGGTATTGNGQQRSQQQRVVLSREQAEMARGLKLDPAVYARGLLEAQRKGEVPMPRAY